MNAIEFLKKSHPAGSRIVTAIHPDRKGIEAKRFEPGEEAAMKEYIAARNGQRNLYFSVNPVKEMPGKPKYYEADVACVAWLHVDIDLRPREEYAAGIERIRNLVETQTKVPRPTVVIFSGGGYQLFWKLKTPIPLKGEKSIEEAKRYNKQLEIIFEGDNCHNLDRIMRLPDTMNLPNARKVQKGRVPVLSEVYWFEDTEYDISDFTPAPETQVAGTDTSSSVTVAIPSNVERINIKDLDKWNVPDRVKVIIVQGRDVEDPKEGDDSRSAWLFDAVCNLIRCEVPDEVVFSIITDPDFGIAESVLEKKPNEGRYATHQIERAKELCADFQCDKHGIPYSNQHNIRVALARLGNALAYDVFSRRLLVNDALLDDAAMTGIYLEIERRFRFRPGKEYFWMVVEDHARQNAVHPVRDYLDALRWDGVPRIATWLIEYAMADDTPYVRAVSKLVLIAAVRRVMEPGCKFDEMLVLESDQGKNKSSALKILAVRKEWFSDDLPLSADTQRLIEALDGRWIVEAAELNGMRKGDVEHLKSFLSRTMDRARMAYGRLVTEVPRQCVIVGTTNSAHYLRDSTGNRRYWPVKIGPFDLDALRRDRDQLWAEAAERARDRSVSIRLPRELWDAAREEQELRRVEDPYFERLQAVLGDLTGKLRSVDAFRVVGVLPGPRQQEHNARIGDAMRRLGWTRMKRRFGGPPEWAYVRGEGPTLGVYDKGEDVGVSQEGIL